MSRSVYSKHQIALEEGEEEEGVECIVHVYRAIHVRYRPISFTQNDSSLLYSMILFTYAHIIC